MKQSIKRVKNRFIKLLHGLDKQEGFVGMLLVMLISVAIFTILSSVHIYTVNHAKFQSRIKEAYGMQIEIENFAVVISDAYNKGQDGTCDTGNECCDVDGVKFEFKKGTTGTTMCSTSAFMPKPGSVCIESPANKHYCLVKIKKASSMGNAPTSSTPSTMDNNEAKQLRACLLQRNDGNCSPKSPTNLAATKTLCDSSSYKDDSREKLCQTTEKYSYNDLGASEKSIDEAINACCSGVRSSVIDCNKDANNPNKNSKNCDDYETTLTGKQRMWCEICEMGGKLFTYYVCPAKAGTPPDPSDCTNKIKSTSSKMEKAQSGIFYQTFRVLPH